MLKYLTDIGLKPEAAEAVAHYMEEKYEIESVDDLKVIIFHVSHPSR